jgi:NAD(P)-dependent dehydrogenase (short-subunit alcohol dehydrogenase family)
MPPPSPSDLTAAGRTLAALAIHLDAIPPDAPELTELLAQMSRVHAARTKHRRRTDRRRDRDLSERVCGLRSGSSVEVPASVPWEWSRPRLCYACHAPYSEVHPFYDSLCPLCANFNYQKRTQNVDLSGRVAVLTGGRVKIGYQVGLKLLRAGAELVVTTRFPADAARRYASEPDLCEWSQRLHIVPLDLRHLGAVESFARYLRERFDRLDILIQNAAQTVRRPPAFYRHLLDGERRGIEGLPPAARELLGAVEANPLLPVPANSDTAWAAEWTQHALLPEDADADPNHFPLNHLDPDGQQVDLRDVNSWTKELPDVSTLELVEAHLANCMAPFVLLRELTPLLRAGPSRDRFVVMVSAREGQFSGDGPSRHPHTNMAKAALNMLTRTSAPLYAGWRVHLTSVDPGWISEQRPREAMPLPLDAVDAAARVLDPVFAGMRTGRPENGVLLKDYQVAPW